MSSKRIPVSVIVLTHNEQINIRECLDSLDEFSELIVVDSGSTDGTLPIIEQDYPDVRLFHHDFEDFGAQRNWAIDNTSPGNEWILFLDADERVTEACRQDISEAVHDPGKHVGYYLTYRNFFLNRPIPRCTLYPTWQLRLFKSGHVRFRAEGHGQREVTNGDLGYLNAPYDHHGFSHGLSHWIARHNRYSSDEALYVLRLRGEPLRMGELFSKSSVKRRRCLKRLAAHAGFRPVLRFVYLYFIRLGLLEGKAGLIFCLLRLSQEVHITAKIAELERSESDERCRSTIVSQTRNFTAHPNETTN